MVTNENDRILHCLMFLLIDLLLVRFSFSRGLMDCAQSAPTLENSIAHNCFVRNQTSAKIFRIWRLSISIIYDVFELEIQRRYGPTKNQHFSSGIFKPQHLKG